MSNSKIASISQFEVVDSNDNNVVLQKRVKAKKRKLKDLKKIQAAQPTTTLHLFSEADFNNLKAIESQLLLDFEQFKGNPKNYLTSFANFIYNFLDIK